MANISRVALTMQVYNQILEGIFQQTYRPGQQLTIQQLAEHLGVSSTPIREALNRLASEGIVELSSFKGFRVAREMGTVDIRNLFDVRIVLETSAVQYPHRSDQASLGGLEDTIAEMRRLLDQGQPPPIQSFSQLDRTFHRLLVEYSGNHFLIAAYQSLDSHIHIGRLYLRNRGVIEAQKIVDEHSAILALYRQGDADLMNAALRAHLESARERVIAFLSR